MSIDTPRTDAATKYVHPLGLLINAELAYQLERENAAMRKRLEILVAQGGKQTNEYVCVDREHDLWKRKEPRTEEVNSDRLAIALAIESIDTLEHDLSAAQLTIARQQQELDASCNAEELRQVRVELAALREDKARLDWLLANCSSFVAEDFTTGNRDLYNIDATTEAIDKAIAERKEKKL